MIKLNSFLLIMELQNMKSIYCIRKIFSCIKEKEFNVKLPLSNSFL